jgi:hypothetical protein
MGTTKRRTFFILLAVCGIGIALLAALGSRSSAPKNQPTSSTAHQGLNENGVELANRLIFDDAKVAITGGKSILSRDDVLSMAHVDMMVSTREYEDDYSNNELAADSKYSNKKLLVDGVVQSIEKDITGTGYFQLRGANPFIGVHARLEDSVMEWARGVKKGNRALLICDSGGRFGGIAIIEHCVNLGAVLKPAIAQEVTGALSGKDSVNKRLAQLISAGYALGIYVPPNSPCFTLPDQEVCAPYLKDPVVKSGVQAKMAAAKAGMRIEQ